LIEIPVKVKLQERARIIPWPTSGSVLRTLEASLPHVKLLGKRVDHAADMV
jgi:hypothetical protein